VAECDRVEGFAVGRCFGVSVLLRGPRRELFAGRRVVFGRWSEQTDQRAAGRRRDSLQLVPVSEFAIERPTLLTQC
jgi:hypothetical protein